MDSMKIEAHAKAMPCIEILYIANVIIIRNLLRKDYKNILLDVLSHYFEEGDHNKVMYYRVSEDKKAGIQDTRVAKAIWEMELLPVVLLEHFTEKFFGGIPEYQAFQRVLENRPRLT